MGDLIQVEHPGPVRHRPARAREERTDQYRMVTPVRLRELALSDTDDGPSYPLAGNRRMRTRLIGGEAWRAVGRDSWDGAAGRLPDAATFRAWLRGEPDAAGLLDRSDVASVFAATPLVARATASGTLVRPHAELPEPRSPLADWRERARSALVDFVERDVAVVDGLPMTRVRGPLAYYDRDASSFRLARFPGTWTTNHVEAIGIFLRIDRVRALARSLHESDGAGRGPWTEASFAGIALRRDDDLAVTAAEGVRKLAEAVSRKPVPWDGALSEATLARLMGLSALATIGFRQEEVPAAFDLVRQASAELGRRARIQPYWLPHLDAYVARVAEPLLAQASAEAAEDAEGLAALAP